MMRRDTRLTSTGDAPDHMVEYSDFVALQNEVCRLPPREEECGDTSFSVPVERCHNMQGSLHVERSDKHITNLWDTFIQILR